MKDEQKIQSGQQYPFFSLANAIQVAEAIRDCGGANGEVPKSSVAHALETSETSGGFIQRVATAKAFGLIEGRGNYQLTDLAKQYFFPTEDGQKERAYSSFLNMPGVFAELIKKFDGQKLPASNLIANIVQRELGVSVSWKDRVTSNFLKSAQAVGALDGNGFLRYRASRHAMKTNQPITPIPTSTFSVRDYQAAHPEEADQSEAPVSLPYAAPVKPAAPGRFSMRIPFGDTFAILETPQRDKLDPELWEMLNVAVQMLKPKPAQ